MTDKVQKIISNLKDVIDDLGVTSPHRLPIIEAIECLQEEPVNRTPTDIEAAMQEVEEKSKAFTDAHKEESADEILAQMRGEEPVSEDLGDYINKLSKQFPEVSFAKLSRIAVRVAKWQKQQDQSTIELAEDHAYFAGRTNTMDEINEALLSEVLPCFMHGGEADEVVAKLDEVLNRKK